MNIEVNCPERRGAQMPEFNPKMVNESEFSDGERFKEYEIEFNPEVNHSFVEWLCQESYCPTAEWCEEIKRAFKANGAKPGHVIYVRFGSRSTGYSEEFKLVVD